MLKKTLIMVDSTNYMLYYILQWLPIKIRAAAWTLNSFF